MPSFRAHLLVDKIVFGRGYPKIHREMDKPFKYLGRKHRIMHHDPASAYFIALKCYPNDSNAVMAAQLHIILDNVCTNQPVGKKWLEAFALLYRKNKSLK